MHTAACAQLRTHHCCICVHRTWYGLVPAQTAEAAFFHHSILAQLSFPAQHKMAVYLPFFLPATLPIAVGLLRELRRARRG